MASPSTRSRRSRTGVRKKAKRRYHPCRGLLRSLWPSSRCLLFVVVLIVGTRWARTHLALKLRLEVEADDDVLSGGSKRSQRKHSETEAERAALLGLSCIEMQQKFAVVAGRTWGKLPFHLRGRWRSLNCNILASIARKQLRVKAVQQGMKPVAATELDQNCVTVCNAFSAASHTFGNATWRCDRAFFELLNDCVHLQANFECPRGCEKNLGSEQPARVGDHVPEGNLPGRCLFTSNPADTSCESSHKYTYRLCPCVPGA